MTIRKAGPSPPTSDNAALRHSTGVVVRKCQALIPPRRASICLSRLRTPVRQKRGQPIGNGSSSAATASPRQPDTSIVTCRLAAAGSRSPSGPPGPPEPDHRERLAGQAPDAEAAHLDQAGEAGWRPDHRRPWCASRWLRSSETSRVKTIGRCPPSAAREREAGFSRARRARISTARAPTSTAERGRRLGRHGGKGLSE